MVGLAQWLVLRRWVRPAGWWILATAVGWALFGPALAFLSWAFHPAVLGAVIGAVVGTGQWLVLRRWVRRADWWILATIASWTGGWLLFWTVDNAGLGFLADRSTDRGWASVVSYVAGGPAGGAVVGAVTGGLLVCLFAQHRQEAKIQE